MHITSAGADISKYWNVFLFLWYKTLSLKHIFLATNINLPSSCRLFASNLLYFACNYSHILKVCLNLTDFHSLSLHLLWNMFPYPAEKNAMKQTKLQNKIRKCRFWYLWFYSLVSQYLLAKTATNLPLLYVWSISVAAIQSSMHSYSPCMSYYKLFQLVT